jgi:hypothetical protein
VRASLKKRAAANASAIHATGKPFVDDWVFDVTVRNGKVTRIREYINTQALAKASARGEA